MRDEQAQAKKGRKDGLAGAVMGLALLAGAVLSMGVVPTKHTTSSIDVAKAEAAALAPTTPDSISPGEEIADKDTLDLQLD